jgi:proteasome accessory factor C
VTEVAQGRLGRRLRRILLLLPYAIRHPGVSVDELSQRFGVDTHDLIEDLNLVFLCGLPGYGPGDLIDVSVEEDRVYVTMADYFSSPLRITPPEALALYAGGAAVAALPDMQAADALHRALDKLGRALSDRGDGRAGAVQVELEPGSPDHLRPLQHALANRKQVHLEYFSASRGAITERVVDPWGLVAALGRWYLIAWDHLSRDERMFRTDRIKRAEVIDQSASIPEEFEPARYKRAWLERGDERIISFEISPETSRWFEDYYPVKKSEALPDGWRRVELATGGDRWASALLLRLGRDVRSVDPPDVMDSARALAQAIAARHRTRGR